MSFYSVALQALFSLGIKAGFCGGRYKKKAEPFADPAL
jgi:hypothetical protein